MKPRFTVLFYNDNGEVIVICDEIDDEKKAAKIVRLINANAPHNHFAYYNTYMEEVE